MQYALCGICFDWYFAYHFGGWVGSSRGKRRKKLFSGSVASLESVCGKVERGGGFLLRAVFFPTRK